MVSDARDFNERNKKRRKPKNSLRWVRKGRGRWGKRFGWESEKKEVKGLGGSVGGVRDEKKEFQRVLLYLKGKMSH